MGSKNKKENRWSDIDGGSAFLIPVTLLKHPNFARLSPHGNKLLMELARQYSGFNNGYLCASWSLMKNAGWKSSHTLQKATLECEHYGLIERTRQGGLNRATLHSLSWRRVDEKQGKPLDVMPTIVPSNAWKVEKALFKKPPPSPRMRKCGKLKIAA